MTQMEKFRKFLKEKFEESEFESIREFARKADVNHAYISRILNGEKKNPPSPDVLQKIAKTLNIGYLDLMIQAGYVDTNPEELSNYVSQIFDPSAILENIKYLFNQLDMEYMEVMDLAIKNKVPPEDLKLFIKNADKIKSLINQAKLIEED